MKATRERLEERLKERMDYQHTLLERQQAIQQRMDEVSKDVAKLIKQIAEEKLIEQESEDKLSTVESELS